MKLVYELVVGAVIAALLLFAWCHQAKSADKGVEYETEKQGMVDCPRHRCYGDRDSGNSSRGDRPSLFLWLTPDEAPAPAPSVRRHRHRHHHSHHPRRAHPRPSPIPSAPAVTTPMAGDVCDHNLWQCFEVWYNFVYLPSQKGN